MNNNIPVNQTNLAGDRVRDLVEALLKLDQDIKVDAEYLRVERGQLNIGADQVVHRIEVACDVDLASVDALIERFNEIIAELYNVEKKLNSIRDLLDA